MRVIYVPGLERSVSVGQYVKAVKFAMSQPGRTFKHGLTCWWACTGADVAAQFRRGLHERINEAIPYVERGQ